MNLGWTWPRGVALRYSARVAVAAFLGYVLSFGGIQYAMYGAFTAALVVGASRGEDTGGAANRARGSLAGMAAGILLAYLPQHPAINVALGVALTTYLCMGFGWGQAAARVGASLCAVTIVAHSQDAVGYTVWRIANTVIGIASGLAVSYFVLPIRGQDLLARDIDRALAAIGRLLDVLAGTAPAAKDRRRFRELFEAMVALEKTLVDASHEFGADHSALRERAQHAAIACVGALGADMAYHDLRHLPDDLEGAASLRAMASALATRTRAAEIATPPLTQPPQPATDDAALHGLALGLRKIDEGLRGLGR